METREEAERIVSEENWVEITSAGDSSRVFLNIVTGEEIRYPFECEKGGK